MEDVRVVSWKINEIERIIRGQHAFVKFAQYPLVHTVTILNQPWTLNISSSNPARSHVLLKRPRSNKVKVTGCLTMEYTPRDNDSSTKSFVKILEANETEVSLPILNKCVRSLYDIVPRGHFTLSIEIHGYLKISEIASVAAEDNSTDGNFRLNTITQLSDDLLCMFKEQSSVFADVNLKCQDVVIPAHRYILSARSPVFAAMFRNRMKETLDGIVCVEDIDPEIFKMMLSYVYAGRTGEVTPETAGQLLFAADKYQLEGLKEICSDCLKTNLCLENALRVLVLGDLHDGSLKAAVLNFIHESVELSQLETSEEWKSMQREKPQLAIEVLCTLVKFYASKK